VGFVGELGKVFGEDNSGTCRKMGGKVFGEDNNYIVVT
jgi:hypothetical protein